MTEVTAKQARAIIQQQEQAEIEACLEEIQAVLKKYGRQLEGVPYITLDGRIAAKFQLVRVEDGGDQ